jgi:hypothetical protein
MTDAIESYWNFWLEKEDWIGLDWKDKGLCCAGFLQPVACRLSPGLGLP